MLKGERGTIWANLMQTLEDMGMKPADVARELGMSHGRLSQIKSGEEPSLVWLNALRLLVEKKTIEQTEDRLSSLKDQAATLADAAQKIVRAIEAEVNYKLQKKSQKTP